jgi:acyl-CoA synthetase (AMP-forming)/AMP-acid ligase II
VIGSAPQQLLHAWRDGRPNFLMLPPGMLTDFLARSPRALRPDPGLYLLVAGSSLPDALNAEARLRMTSCVYNVYGSTECSTHSICNAADSMGRPGHVGYPVPYADVQVVDEKGQPMPSGEEGEVRVRAPGMATAYLEDDAASREAFRGGWFHPGDTGRIDADGSLTITGRVKELVNDGGVKIAPARIDELARSVEGVFDAAAFASRDSGGDHLCIAVVAGPAFDESELLARYRAAFPTHPKPAIVRVDAIPRNEMGKVQRTRLAQSRTSSTPRQ